MSDRRVLQDAVPEIEDVRAVSEGVKDALDCGPHRLSAGDQRQRVEIALERKVLRQFLGGPGRIDGFVKAERGHASLSRISRKLTAGALWESDHRYIRMPFAK